ncbi:hypothetical protein BDQ17DRAFT_1331901 [Cyathus striatus]|nr:hypothetical protein BDQ17DRAFT_1331901 [Cyathus striatus]
MNIAPTDCPSNKQQEPEWEDEDEAEESSQTLDRLEELGEQMESDDEYELWERHLVDIETGKDGCSSFRALIKAGLKVIILIGEGTSSLVIGGPLKVLGITAKESMDATEKIHIIDDELEDPIIKSIKKATQWVGEERQRSLAQNQYFKDPNTTTDVDDLRMEIMLAALIQSIKISAIKTYDPREELLGFTASQHSMAVRDHERPWNLSWYNLC